MKAAKNLLGGLAGGIVLNILFTSTLAADTNLIINPLKNNYG